MRIQVDTGSPIETSPEQSAFEHRDQTERRAIVGVLDGRVALVTGGSKGLGAATARLFAEAGARVVVTFANDAEAADRLIASLPGTGHRASHTPAQDTGAIESFAAAIGTTEGRLDILINNAGSTRVIPHADLHAL